MSQLASFFKQWGPRIEQELKTQLPDPTQAPARLHEAMHYAVVDGGKRLRPLLCLAAAEACGGDPEDALLPGLAIEILHAYTLVHDDLPCMDDDDLRRGKPSTHKAFGEALALLAGDALLTLAFEWTAESAPPDPYPGSQYTLELARHAGSCGVIGGQVVDLESEGQALDLDRLRYIHRHKTAFLIKAALRMGGISAGASPAQLQALTTFGEEIGLAFQITDDLLDETQTSEVLGKPAGSDAENQKLTFPALMGLEASKEEAKKHTQAALAALEDVELSAQILVEMADRLVNRSH